MSDRPIDRMPDPADFVPSDHAERLPGIAIQTSNLIKRYGNHVALQNVSLAVPESTIYGIIGPNGAGKTTTFSIVASLLEPTSGRAFVAGYDTQREPLAVRKVLGFMPDTLGVYDGLAVGEYLSFFAAAYEIPRRTWPALIDGLLELTNLEVKRDAMVNGLSRGMKQRLSLARALIHDPSILVLDEPASGLDPRARVELRELLFELNRMGKTIVISSHILADLQELCSQIAIMEGGRLLASGAPHDILDRVGGERRVKVTYLNGRSEEFTVGSPREQRDLLKRLVSLEKKDVVEMRVLEGGLEDLFLSVTEGKLQ